MTIVPQGNGFGPTGRRAISLAGGMLLAAATWGAPPPAVLDYRHHMFDPPVRAFANRTAELVFDSVRVEPALDTWKLGRKPAALDFTYEFGGKVHQATDVLESTYTDALLILKNGVIVYENYLNRADERTHFMSYSMSKSMNSVMLGFAVQDGYVKSIAEPITNYVPELKGTAYDGTTVADVLRMRSGTDWDDNFFKPGPAKDINELAFMRGEARFVSAASWPKRAHAPGEVFNYNTVDAALIGLVVERAAKRPISQYMSERFWKPAGMESYAFYILDGPPGEGREFTGGGFNAVLRDYGRVGLMMAQLGVANGRKLLSPAWVQESTAAAVPRPGDRAEAGLGYAYLWWTFDGSRAFTALGGEGQFVFVDPETQTVIVKLSHAPVGPEGQPVSEETYAFLKAASKWRPKTSLASPRLSAWCGA